MGQSPAPNSFAWADGRELTGYLNVMKPPGMTSHDVVSRIRRLSGQRRTGHTGTLDPAAVGVLPVALGRATRTVSSPRWDQKLYWADVVFGKSTDTDDADGRVLATGDAEQVELFSINETLRAFVGPVAQRPPAYSAVHVAPGQRAYQQARRSASGDAREEVIIASRLVRIDGIAVLGWKTPLLSLVVQCGPGTYIRSLARDLGKAVGCPAHLAALARLRVGPFTVSDALDLRAIESVAARGAWDRILWPMDALGIGPDSAIVVPGARVAFATEGRSWPVSGVQTEGPPHAACVYLEDGRALGFATSRDGRWFPAARMSGWETVGPGSMVGPRQ